MEGLQAVMELFRVHLLTPRFAVHTGELTESYKRHHYMCGQVVCVVLLLS